MLIRLVLQNFRNHKAFELTTNAKWVYIIGANGNGKTNILEALSLLSPGKGLRSSHLNDISTKNSSQNTWTIFCEYGQHQIGVSYQVKRIKGTKILRINGNTIRSSSELLKYLRVIWLTPQMDAILAESRTIKRKFLDRLTFNFFPKHAESVNRFEHANKERLRLLTGNGFDDIWLSNLENVIAEESINIIKQRHECITIISKQLEKFNSSFLKPILKLNGKIESKMASLDEQLLKEYIIKELQESRKIDAIRGSSSIGAHKSEFIAIHPVKQIIAEQCSTGEQKAMLISLIVAQVKSLNEIYNLTPLLLLDDIFSHLDINNTENLLKELGTVDAQIWITLTNINENLLTKYCYNFVKISI